jgi:mono/diheme cytochrome c family protein
MPTTDCARRSPCVARALLACAAGLALTGSSVAQTHYGFGRPATPAQIAAWDIDVAPDGRNLPAGHGSVAHGREVYKMQCAVCHGANGEGALGDKLAGGMGSLATPKPVKTVGSFWPYATTLFDYVRRAMPLNAPQSLSNEDVYAVCGYVLFLNGLVSESAVIDAGTLISLKMPNREGFVGDPRPDVKDAGCMHNCAK